MAFRPYLEDDDEERGYALQLDRAFHPDLQPMPPEYDPMLVQRFVDGAPKRPEMSSRDSFELPEYQPRDGNFLEDNAWAIGGGILDILANKGRGLGSIAQMAAIQESNRNKAHRAAFESDRDALQRAQQLQAQHGDTDFERYAKERGMNLRASELELSQATERRLLDAFTRQGSSPMDQAELRYKLAQAMKAEREASMDPGALTPQQVYERGRDTKADERADERLKLEKERLNRMGSGGGFTPYQQYQVDRSVKLDKAARGDKNQASLDKFNKENEYELKAIAPFLEAQRIAQLYEGKDIPAIGLFDSNLPDQLLEGDALKLRNSTRALGRLAQRTESGAAGPSEEYVRYMGAAGAGRFTTEEQFRDAMRQANEYLGGQLKRASSGREQVVYDALMKSDPTGAQARFVLGDYQPTKAPDDAAPSGGGGGGGWQLDTTEDLTPEQLQGLERGELNPSDFGDVAPVMPMRRGDVNSPGDKWVSDVVAEPATNDLPGQMPLSDEAMPGDGLEAKERPDGKFDIYLDGVLVQSGFEMDGEDVNEWTGGGGLITGIN